MTTDLIPPTNISPPETGMYKELLWVHAHLRRDLATVARLARETRDGLSPETILAEIRNLETNSPLWRLRYGCIRYCRFLHTHHTIEDAMLFPAIRKQTPGLGRVIDKLEEDHLVVHHLTEEIVAIAERVPGDASGISRLELANVLGQLEQHLLTHLGFEEQSIGPLLSTWTEWPVE